MQNRNHVSVKPGRIVAINDDGTYAVLPDTGRDSGIPIDGVRPIIAADLSLGDRVVLFWERPGEHPRILVTGSGGGATCAGSVNNLGLLY